MKRIQVNKAYSFKEADLYDIKFWRRAGTTAIFSAAWKMVKELLKIRGMHGNKPRLRRTVQSIERL